MESNLKRKIVAEVSDMNFGNSQKKKEERKVRPKNKHGRKSKK